MEELLNTVVFLLVNQYWKNLLDGNRGEHFMQVVTQLRENDHDPT